MEEEDRRAKLIKHWETYNLWNNLTSNRIGHVENYLSSSSSHDHKTVIALKICLHWLLLWVRQLIKSTLLTHNLDHFFPTDWHVTTWNIQGIRGGQGFAFWQTQKNVCHDLFSISVPWVISVEKLFRKSRFTDRVKWVSFSLTFAKSFARDCNNSVTTTSVLLQFTSVTVSFPITPANEVHGWRARFRTHAISWTIRLNNTPGVVEDKPYERKELWDCLEGIKAAERD